MTKRLKKNESLKEYVTRRIGDIFNDTAEIAGEILAAKYGEDMPAGAMAFQLMKAQMKLEAAWDKICDEQDAETDV
jgi:hypothetical protein